MSPNIDARRGNAMPDMIVLHYTGMASAAAAVHWLCTRDSKVSCHYLVDEDGAITQMVGEEGHELADISAIGGKGMFR